MTPLCHIENIVTIIAIVLIVIFAPGWWKLMAFLPALYMNDPSG